MVKRKAGQSIVQTILSPNAVQPCLFTTFAFPLPDLCKAFVAKTHLYEDRLINSSVNPSHGYPIGLYFKKLAF